MLTPTTEHHFLTAENRSGSVFDWSSIGEYVRTVRDSHDLILEIMLSMIVTDAKRYPVKSWERSFFRGQYQIIQDERKARRSGDLPYFMRPNLKKEQSIRERCESVHDKIAIEHFIERELGIQLRRNRCRCPVHDGDSEYSFSIRNGYAKCFVCGFSGDVITLAQELWKLARPIDAVKRLEGWG